MADFLHFLQIDGFPRQISFWGSENFHSQRIFTDVQLETAQWCLCMCMHVNVFQLSFFTWHDCKRNSHPDFSHPHEYRKKEFKGCLILCIHCEIPECWKYILLKRDERYVIYCLRASNRNVTVHHVTLSIEWEFTLLLWPNFWSVILCNSYPLQWN